MLTALTLTLIGGCAPSLPGPAIHAVQPPWAYQDLDAQLEIVGENFFPEMRVELMTGGPEARFDDDYQLFLTGPEQIRLESVVLLDYDRLQARLPAGHQEGRYELRLIAPDGEEASLESALEITSSLAEQIVFDLESASFPVGEAVQIPLRLATANGETATEAVRVQLSLEPLSGEVGFGDGHRLQGHAAISEEQLEGWLSEDGSGAVEVLAETTGSAWLRVSTPDYSWVEPSSVLLTFSESSLSEVQVELPEQDIVAGESFEVTLSLRDEEGRLLEDLYTELIMAEVCGSYLEEHRFVGQLTTRVTLEQATEDSGCESNALVIYGLAPGQSPDFFVQPGPVASLQLSSSATEVTAGEESLQVWVQPVDRYGNRQPSVDLSLHFVDDLGGLDTLQGLGSVQCSDSWPDGQQLCTLALLKAGESITVTARDSEQPRITGQVEGIQVAPASPVTLSLSSDSSLPQAGELWSLSVEALDSYANRVSIEPGDVSVTIEDPSDDVTCEVQGYGDGLLELGCTGTRAEPRDLTVSLPEWGVSAVSSLDMVNGELAALSWSLSSSTLTAGQGVLLELLGEDSWGNPYLISHTGGEISLSAEGAALSPSTLTLDSEGRASAELTLETSGSHTISLSHQLSVLESIAVEVSAASLAQISLDLSSQWLWLGEGLEVDMELQDAFGNRTDAESGSLEIRSSSGGFEAQSVSYLDGTARVTLYWDEAVLSDTLEVEHELVEVTSSDPIDVLLEGCEDGPVAVLELDGLEEVVTCLSLGASQVSAWVGDSEGASHWHLSWEEQQERISSDTLLLETSSVGAHQVELIAVDEEACADRIVAQWWVGMDDGTPAGPISMTDDGSSLSAGSKSAITDITLQALDCAGDLAQPGGQVYLRANRGELIGALSSGQGLYAELDAAGQATLTWSFVDSIEGGESLIETGTGTGESYGSLQLTVTGDDRRPQVIAATPSGSREESIEQVLLQFSEPLLESSLSEETLLLESESSGAVGLTWSLSEGGELLTLQPEEPLDGSSEVYQLTLTGQTYPAVRDSSGNRLDGSWQGTASDYSLRFGLLDEQALSWTQCSQTEESFRPDGDSGTGAESDELELYLEASGTPAYWRALFQVGEESVVIMQEAGLSSETLTWDGRDQSGKLFDPGSGTWAVQIIDSQGNVSDSCGGELTLLSPILRPSVAP